MKWLVGVACLFLAGCEKYADFRLPAAGGEALEVRWRWHQEPHPVLSHGVIGEFDSVDALNPSVAKTASGYLNLYSGWDGKVWRTGLATSKDGITWEKKGLILQPGPSAWEGSYIAANGAVHESNYYYQAGNPPQIGLARALRNKLAQPVLQTGPRGSWDERGVADLLFGPTGKPGARRIGTRGEELGELPHGDLGHLPRQAIPAQPPNT